jgi:hypothetical protein
VSNQIYRTYFKTNGFASEKNVIEFTQAIFHNHLLMLSSELEKSYMKGFKYNSPLEQKLLNENKANYLAKGN